MILADEPTGNLDEDSATLVADLLVDQSRGTRTLIVATHDDRIADRLDRVVAIAKGRVQGGSSAAEASDVASSDESREIVDRWRPDPAGPMKTSSPFLDRVRRRIVSPDAVDPEAKRGAWG